MYASYLWLVDKELALKNLFYNVKNMQFTINFYDFMLQLMDWAERHIRTVCMV